MLVNQGAMFLLLDPTKVPDPKYFKEILTEAEVEEFCEDFIRLLHHNQKRHKDKVPCLIGAANSGKTSLFQPILGLVHHSNIVIITKQRVFNKAMINRFTEVIFIDEARENPYPGRIYGERHQVPNGKDLH